MKIDVYKISPRQKLTIAKGLCDYQFIMDNWQSNGIDFEDFKDVYYEFYLKARWAVMSNPRNYTPYFEKMRSIDPSTEVDLMNVLEALKKETASKSYEFSLVSKMLHTIKPFSIPIYDSKVREYLFKEENVNFWWQIPNKESGAPRGTSEKDKIEHDWNLLCDWYKKILHSERGNEWIKWFNENFPAFEGISDIKKIDFIIFATN